MLRKFFLTSLLAVSASVPTAATDLPKFMERFDVDGDGAISEEERQARGEMFAQLRKEGLQSIDFDNDGEISEDEAAEAREALRESIAQRRRAKFLALAGEDGFISESEYRTIPGIGKLTQAVSEAIFDRLDLDRDGLISEEEFFRKLRRSLPKDDATSGS